MKTSKIAALLELGPAFRKDAQVTALPPIKPVFKPLMDILDKSDPVVPVEAVAEKPMKGFIAPAGTKLGVRDERGRIVSIDERMARAKGVKKPGSAAKRGKGKAAKVEAAPKKGKKGQPKQTVKPSKKGGKRK